MTVPVYDFFWQQGADNQESIVYKRDDKPVDLTGYNLRMDIKLASGVYTINTANAQSPADVNPEVTLNSLGEIHIIVPREETLSGGDLFSSLNSALPYDIFLRNPEGLQEKILRGTIYIQDSSTLWT